MLNRGGAAPSGIVVLFHSRLGDDMDLRTVLTAVESWPAEERMRLIEEIWESLEATPEGAALTESQREDLQRRLDAYRDDPGAGSPWEEVKARLQGDKR